MFIHYVLPTCLPFPLLCIPSCITMFPSVITFLLPKQLPLAFLLNKCLLSTHSLDFCLRVLISNLVLWSTCELFFYLWHFSLPKFIHNLFSQLQWYTTIIMRLFIVYDLKLRPLSSKDSKCILWLKTYNVFRSWRPTVCQAMC